jgi:hypothetical protein
MARRPPENARVIAAIVIACVVVGVPAGPQDPPAPAARLIGRVVEASSRAAIAGVRVEIPDLGRFVMTSPDGRFVLDAVPPGLHTVVATLPGFQPAPPSTVRVGLAGEVSLDIEYPLAMAAEVRARLPPAPAGAIATTATSTLGGRRITMAPGALEDVHRAFQAQPGAAAPNDDRNDLLVRGGGAIENAIRLDGFDIPNASHFGAQGGSGGGLSFIPPWLIDTATLEPGGFSVESGERASSVLHLSLVDGHRRRVTGGVGASVGGAMAFAGGPIAGGRGAWLASVRRSFLELVFERGNARVAPRYADALVKTEWSLSPRHEAEWLCLMAADTAEAESRTSAADRLRDHQRVGLTGLALRSAWSETTTTALFLSYGVNRIDAEEYDNTVVDGADHSREAELRARVEVRHTLSETTTVMAGASAKRAFLRFNLQADAFRNDYNNIVPALRQNRREQLTDGGAYAQATVRLARKITVEPGIRLDRSGTRDRSYVSPRVKAAADLSTRVRVTGAWGIYRQAIPYIWIGSHPANARLDPIRSSQTLAGLAVRAPRSIRLSAEAFDKRYIGYPVDPTAPARVLVGAAADFESPFVGELVDGGRLTARGVDTTAVFGLGSRVEVTTGYSWWRVRQRGLDGAWRAADYDMRHQARAEVVYRHPRRWSASALWRYGDGRPYTPFDVTASIRWRSPRYDRARVNDARYPPYHRLDLRTDWEISIPHARLTLFAEVQNAYDRSNIYLYDWSRGLREAVPIYQRGLLPVAGFRLEF